MKKQFTLKCLMATAALFCLSACMKFEAEIRVLPEETTVYTGDFYLSKEVLNEEETAEQFLTRVLPTIVISEAGESEEMIDGVTYRHFEFQGTLDSDNVTVTKKGSQVLFRFVTDEFDDLSGIVDLDVIGNNDDLQSLSEFGISAVLKIRMPGDIVSSNVGEIDGNTVSINLLTAYRQDIEVISTTQTASQKIAMAVLALTTLGYCTYITLRKN